MERKLKLLCDMMMMAGVSLGGLAGNGALKHTHEHKLIVEVQRQRV